MNVPRDGDFQPNPFGQISYIAPREWGGPPWQHYYHDIDNSCQVSRPARQPASQLGSRADIFLRIYHLRIHSYNDWTGGADSRSNEGRRPKLAAVHGAQEGESVNQLPMRPPSDRCMKWMQDGRQPAVRNSPTCRDRPCLVSLSTPIPLMALLLLLLLQSQQLLLSLVHCGAVKLLKLDDVPV